MRIVEQVEDRCLAPPAPPGLPCDFGWGGHLRYD